MHDRFIKHEDNATVGKSGNSDVDITIDIDTTAIAYAMLCSLYATNRLNSKEFDLAIRKFDSLMERKERRPIKYNNDASSPKLYNIPSNNRRRS
ncbi:hypothetical protein [Ornithinibacillus bavariensis]|uniref:Uncharacterized protein n=1 Tax=Ornithinibacillus bavariensis TaxID=545502 RepID=A0A920C6R0_9BACI|nr:hypothetical protein [Ornithinibacillus bavariensis]GIO26364.1 hypothetical protein J43TS3_09750 [Ornithinibacillus bavariensis]HAM81603.1 hypothetical protein [Ornithinibacillus sp.]